MVRLLTFGVGMGDTEVTTSFQITTGSPFSETDHTEGRLRFGRRYEAHLLSRAFHSVRPTPSCSSAQEGDTHRRQGYTGL